MAEKYPLEVVHGLGGFNLAGPSGMADIEDTLNGVAKRSSENGVVTITYPSGVVKYMGFATTDALVPVSINFPTSMGDVPDGVVLTPISSARRTVQLSGFPTVSGFEVVGFNGTTQAAVNFRWVAYGVIAV